MNDNFINIKVDKEVRSDVDRVYMTYVQVIPHPPIERHLSFLSTSPLFLVCLSGGAKAAQGMP